MRNNIVTYSKTFSCLFLISVLFGCGGGSGSTNTSVSNIPWEKNVYPKPSMLKDYCENPRTPSANSDYSDKQGSHFLEKMWLRSWSEDVYLWYQELTDIDVNSVDSPQDYFKTRKTNAVTPSGKAKDQFHFYVDTEANDQQVSSGASTSYGMTFDFLSTVPPRRAVVIYVEPNSPADLANIERGAEIVTVDDADLIFGNEVATLNDGLFPATANETHVFGIVDSGRTTTRTVSLQSAVIAEDSVQSTKIFTETVTGEKVGYLMFNTFGTYTAEASLVDSFNYLASNNVSDLVLDLRYNGGGFLAISSQLAYMIAGSNAANRVYYKPVFNSKYPANDPISGEAIQAYPFFGEGLGLTTPAGTDLPTLNLGRVYVITTASTCSASEALINGLQGIGVDVIQIGSKTCGKPYGFQGTDNCGTTYYTIMFKGVNGQGFGDYPDGFYPSNSISQNGSVSVLGCEVADDYSNQLGDIDEAMLNAALDYRITGNCPAQSGLLARAETNQDSVNDSGNLLSDPRLRNQQLLKKNLILNHK